MATEKQGVRECNTDNMKILKNDDDLYPRIMRMAKSAKSSIFDTR